MKFLLRKEISKLGFFNAIYLFDNNYQSLFSKSSNCIIGSNHCWEPSNRSTFDLFKNKLIASKLIWGAIDSFHLFPGKSWLTAIDNRIGDFILSNGVDYEKFKSAKVKTNKFKILYNSRLDKCKGIKAVLESAQLLEKDANLGT